MNIVIKDSSNNQIVTRPDLNIISTHTDLYILEKIFALTDDIKFYNHFTRLEHTEKFLYKIYNIIHDLENINHMNIFFLSDPDFLKIFEEYNILYPSLTVDDFHFIIELFVLKMDPSDPYNIKSKVTTFVSNIITERKNLSDRYIQEEVLLTNFYNSIRDNSNKIDSFIDFESIVYNSITFLLGNNDRKTGIAGSFINIQKLFNNFELSETVPMIAMITVDNTPIVKVYNNVKNTVKDATLQKWLLNEKNEISIKKYGLMMKYRIDDQYATVYIISNGDVNIKIQELNGSLNDIKTSIVKYTRELVDKFDSNIYLDSRRIKLQNIDTLSMTCSISTTFDISRNIFINLLGQKGINKIFTLKNTASETMISFIELPDNNVVNIKDNPLKKNSSIITIYNKTHWEDILNTVYIIINVYKSHNRTEGETVDGDDRKLKQVSQIKELRSKGVYIHSKKCQKQKQPVVNTDRVPLDDAYLLDFQGNTFMCPNPEYKYPGFTREDIVCCFKKDQRSKDVYIKNTNQELLDIKVSPSNFKMTIHENDGPEFTTHVIKKLGDDSLNYISPITNKLTLLPEEYIETVINREALANQQHKTIWIKDVPLAFIIMPPSKNKCNIPPVNTTGPLNERCEKNDYIFSYNSQGIPCCFKEARDEAIVKIYNEQDIKHIIKAAKILDPGRIGELSEMLHITFNQVLPLRLPENIYYRFGVIQGPNAFMNVVTAGVDKSRNLINHQELKKFLNKYIKQHPFNYDSSISTILNNESTNYNWATNVELLDLLSNALHINIIILDNTTSTAPRILCTNFRYLKNARFIIILKYNEIYELIVCKTRNRINYNYDINDSIIHFLLKYYKESCSRISVLPQTYPFEPLMTYKQVYDKIGKENIIAQIVNEFYSTEMLLTREYACIPILETSIIQDLKTIYVKQLLQWPKLLDLNALSSIYKKSIPEINIIGVTVTDNTDDDSSMITSVQTNVGVLVPVKKSIYDDSCPYPKLPYNYYSNVNIYLKADETTIPINKAIVYSKRIKELLQEVVAIKTTLADLFTNKVTHDEKNSIISTITNVKISRKMKFEMIYNKLKQLTNLDSIQDLFILKIITNEVIQDSMRNNLLNGIVHSQFFNKNEIIERDNESVLYSVDDFWIWTSHQTQ